ncbi:Ubiquitin domain-containing protein 2 [Coemansia sp. RSA 988]|nr:Ubiquitin domain-containing protein 2 [Coemansia sp. RSA 988]
MLTREDLEQQRLEFWETAPVYGGQREIWQALRVACESEDLEFAYAILDSVGISVPSGCILDGVYDERGARYDIPQYCLSAPVNLVESTGVGSSVRLIPRTQQIIQQRGSITSEDIQCRNENGQYGDGTTEQEEGVRLDNGIPSNKAPAIGARTSMDSTQSIDIRTAVVAASSSPSGGVISPTTLTIGRAAPAGFSFHSPKSMASSDAISFASSSMLPSTELPQEGVPGNSRIACDALPKRLIVRLSSGGDVEVSVTADTTIAQIEQHLRDSGSLADNIRRIQFFYLGRLLSPQLEPLRDIHLTQPAIIQAMVSIV